MSVCTVSGLFFQGFICLNDLAHFAWFTSGAARGQLGGSSGVARRQLRGGSGSSMEDDLWWKTTLNGRGPLIEDDLWWKTTYDERRFMMEDDFWWKTTDDGRRLMMKEDLQWKTTCDGRRPSMEDDLWSKSVPIMFLFVLSLHRRRSDYCHRVAIFLLAVGFFLSP